jgi:hypothetical protein
MNLPGRPFIVLLDKWSWMPYPLDYKCLPDNYVAIFQTLVALMNIYLLAMCPSHDGLSQYSRAIPRSPSSECC